VQYELTFPDGIRNLATYRGDTILPGVQVRGTNAPTGNGCSTIEITPLVSSPQSLNATPIDPRSPVRPAPG
jgi:hypothetical protein